MPVRFPKSVGLHRHRPEGKRGREARVAPADRAELRYYAGGWCPDQNRIYQEQDRIVAEGCELGVFRSVRDALTFTEKYLADERSFGAVQVPREVRFSHYPKAGDAEPDAPANRPRD